MVIEIPKIKSNPAFFNQPEFHQKIQDKDQKYVIDLIKSWLEAKQDFEFATSGSTGTPKKVLISRQILEYSTLQTMNYLQIGTGGHSLLCIPPNFIGGQMVVIRSILNNMILHVAKPTISLSHYPVQFKLASMIPAQIESILQRDSTIFNQFEHILIGGAPMSNQIEKMLQSIHTNCKFHITYGMTETASHIALRSPGEVGYKLLGDASIKTNEIGCLMIKGSVTNKRWIETSDLVNIKDDQTFEWLGRADFIINSGGIKINPETVELKLSEKFSDKLFFVTSIPHPVFGEQLVLVIAGPPFDFPDSYLTELSKYEKPKKIFWISKFEYTTSGKLDRINLRNKLLSIFKKNEN